MGEIVQHVLCFDRFALDLRRGSLRAGHQDIDLRPKAFEVLRHLATNAGVLVSKQALYEAVWPNLAVSDDSLVQCIRELRQKLGDRESRRWLGAATCSMPSSKRPRTRGQLAWPQPLRSP